MKKTLFAGFLSLSLAATSLMPTAAMADERDDFARALLGIAAAIAIGNAIKNNTDDDRPAVTPHRPNPPPAPHPQPSSRRVLPSECLTTVDTRRGEVRLFGNRCLQENYRYANRLPSECRITVEGRRHTRVGYVPRCLRDRGYTTDRRW